MLRLGCVCNSRRNLADAYQEIDWESSAGKDGPRAYVELLAKETATLHKVLSKYLATQTVEVRHVVQSGQSLTLQGVMSQVLDAIVQRLTDEYSKVEFKSEDAKKRYVPDSVVPVLISAACSSMSHSSWAN